MASINFLGFMPIEQIKASGITFDYALPQQWVNIVTDKLGDRLLPEENVASHFVYVYPEGNIMGGVMPVDVTGATIIQMYSEA
jgi:hypothetical protein